MTFIASVISKNGVAVIADSLVTTSRRIIDFDDFMQLIEDKVKPKGRGRRKKHENVTVKPGEIINLFKIKPSHTKNYEEKLFKYDQFTCITTAGSASINNKRISEIVREAVASNSRKRKRKGASDRDILLEKVEGFKQIIEKEAFSHLMNEKSIKPTIFILTNYNKKQNKTTIFKLSVRNEKLTTYDKDKGLIEVEEQPEEYKVVCDGQNRISERILWGELMFLWWIVPKILGRVGEDFPEIKDKLNDQYIYNLLKHKDIISHRFISDDIKMTKLTDLSLQQAIDLACLLMRIEMDIQKFTEDIPTVGGVIKLAVIDKSGFKFLSGDEIEVPTSI